MLTIVINSQKGGSGKTTLCAHLSVEAERAGNGPVFLIDTDPQGTLTTCHEKRQAEAPQRVELPFDGIAEGLRQLRERNAAFCFIDTAPSRTDETAVLFDLADLVIVPIRPSPSDLWAASATVELLKREKVPFLFVLNQAKANAGITGQAADRARANHQRIHACMLPCFHENSKGSAITQTPRSHGFRNGHLTRQGPEIRLR